MRSAGALVIEPATESNMPANMELILEEEGELLEPSEVLPAQHELESADLASHSEGYARLQDEHAATDAVVPYSALNAYLAELRRFSPFRGRMSTQRRSITMRRRIKMLRIRLYRALYGSLLRLLGSMRGLQGTFSILFRRETSDCLRPSRILILIEV